MTDHVLVLFDRKSMSFLILINIDSNVVEINISMSTPAHSRVFNKRQQALTPYEQGYYWDQVINLGLYIIKLLSFARKPL